MTKTNAMRLLDAAGISYSSKEYEYDESDLSGHQREIKPDPLYSAYPLMRNWTLKRPHPYQKTKKLI